MMTRQTPIRYAQYWPLQKTPWGILLVCAFLAIAAWWGVHQYRGSFTHRAYQEMMQAAQTMQAATQVVRMQRKQLGLMQTKTLDPNQTGLIGAEYTDTTTSLGDVAAKRTATNPDLAAAITRRLVDFDLPAGSPVLILLSGSFIGANIATIIATESAGLKPIIVSSLGASMYGATDAELTWLDIEAELYDKGIIKNHSILSLLGGVGARGLNLSDEGIAAFRQATLRHNIPLLEEDDLAAMLDEVDRRVQEQAGGVVSLFINSGGSVLALGTCQNGDQIPTAVNAPLTCVDGLPGMIVRKSHEKIHGLHILALRAVAADWDLPFDPIPLPLTGNNKLVYGNSGQHQPVPLTTAEK